MKRSDHSFDWEGFFLMTKLVLVLAVVLGIGYNGILYVHAHTRRAAVATAPVIPVITTDAPTATTTTTALDIGTTTPLRLINTMTIADAVPASGKFIGADLVAMKLYLYQDGTTTAEYPILTKGKPGSPYDTPAGMYTVLTKETNHLNRAERVNMPYSMEFYGNYFIHGWPVYTSGKAVASTYSGGCIRLSTADAAQVYAFADKNTKVFVYDSKPTAPLPTLSLANTKVPAVSANAYLVADMDTGDVYAEHNTQTAQPIASLTKLMTALVANETIMFDRKITVSRNAFSKTATTTTSASESFAVGDLLYPLIMESNSTVANTLSNYYGSGAFVDWMNKTAVSLDMASTTYADATGESLKNTSTPDDLYRLSVYLANKKSFIWDITRTPSKTLIGQSGTEYTVSNINSLANSYSFDGSTATSTNATSTMASVFTFTIGGQKRRIAVITLGSASSSSDTRYLADWFNKTVRQNKNTACATCAQPTQYRKIEL